MIDNSVFDSFKCPMYLMAKPVGARCNLACTYCYYTEKKQFYNKAINLAMSDELLHKFVRDYIQSQTTDEVLFTWHGGEPLLAPLSFYKKAVEFQKFYADGRIIDNCIQTNGLLLDDDWCQFFHDNNWLVGLSIDGDKNVHDKYRITPNGKGTFYKVIKAIELLNKYDVQYNAMAVVNAHNVNSPENFYNFFKSINCNYIQFAPIVERIKPDGTLASAMYKGECSMSAESISAEQWGNFLCEVFDLWIKHDVGKVFIQLFDATLANWVGEPPGVCILSKRCGNVGVIEHNGDIYACDHFVFPDFKLGNLNNQSIVDMMSGIVQSTFASLKPSLSDKCKKCKYLFACNGECPKNRFVYTDESKHPDNYLCEGYYKFFEHTASAMQTMTQLLNRGLSPALISNN